MLTVGLPAEWKAFEARQQRFLELFPALEDACNVAFRRARLTCLTDALVHGIGRVCAEEFLEILLLCGNGYGIAAARLIRSMYERAVTASYLDAHPDESERYLRYSEIQKGKLARVWLEMFRDGIPKDRIETLEKAVVAARELKDDYVIRCEKCGHPRPSPGWGPDLVSMAKADGPLKALLGGCYYYGMLHAHATPHSVEAFIHRQEDDAWTFDFQAQHTEADHALFHAHTILMVMLQLQEKRFHPDGLAPALEAADRAFGEIWNAKDKASASQPPERKE
ncbi:MAG TPA: DUF5677 domain-containing protein [Vicinamibacteria bacterium]|nr:DUF5677 domain-containing protein [Vicinamibacteria bacterium]